jgi:hypothetical protein
MERIVIELDENPCARARRLGEARAALRVREIR